MSQPAYLTNQLLIAMPALADPNFNRTVTLICEHTDQGALGIVINRPLDVRLSEIFAQLKLDRCDEQASQQIVLHGGPVQQERGFVLHDDERAWDSTLRIADRCRFSLDTPLGYQYPHELVPDGHTPQTWLRKPPTVVFHLTGAPDRFNCPKQ